MTVHQLLKESYRASLRKVLVFCLLLLGAAVAAVFAQNSDDIYGDRGGPSRQNNGPSAENQSSNPGVSAGGNWLEYDSEDKMTAAKRATFELLSDNTLQGNRDARARVEISCENGKYKASQFIPGVRLAPPNRPGFWGQPQMEVMVRVDGAHDNHGWNWSGRFLAMDKGTAREMIGAQIFKIEFLGRRGPEIAEFSPAGIDLAKVAQVCELKPKKP